MSSIIVNFSKESGAISFVEQDLHSSYGDIYMGVDIPDGQGTVVFDALFFGFTLWRNGQALATQEWPLPGAMYISTNEDFLECKRVEWQQKWDLKLDVWFKESNVTVKDSYEFTVPIPPKPYPDWVWINEGWYPPKPYPADGKMYVWNPRNSSWLAT